MQHETDQTDTPTADDVPNLAKYGLNDFAVDFSGVAKPGGLDVAALQAYADSLCVSATDAERARARIIHEALRLGAAVEVVNLRYIDGKMSAEDHLAALRVLYGYDE